MGEATGNVYREAGSFVRYLIDHYGLDPLKAFFRASGVNDSRTVIRDRFQAAFGRPLTAVEAEWLAFIDAR